MITNKEILENGYWSSSSSSSIRSEFDDEYYRMKPPPPKFEDYLEKIVVIKEGQFPQSEAQLQNVILSNKSKTQSNVQQKPDNKDLVGPSSKSETNINGRQAPKRERFERRFPPPNIANENDVQHNIFNHGHSYNYSKPNTTEQDQNFTTNENFRGGPNYTGPFTNKNANVNNTKPHQYPTPHTSNTKSNELKGILSKKINQTSTTLYSINSTNIAEDTWREKIKPLPSQDTTPRSVKIEKKRLHDVPLPKPSTSTVPTASINGRCNTLSRKVNTASGKSKLPSSNHSKTYNTFLAVQPTASINTTIQIQQPTMSNSVERNEAMTTESTKEKCYKICCFWFNCCA